MREEALVEGTLETRLSLRRVCCVRFPSTRKEPLQSSWANPPFVPKRGGATEESPTFVATSPGRKVAVSHPFVFSINLARGFYQMDLPEEVRAQYAGNTPSGVEKNHCPHTSDYGRSSLPTSYVLGCPLDSNPCRQASAWG